MLIFQHELSPSSRSDRLNENDTRQVYAPWLGDAVKDSITLLGPDDPMPETTSTLVLVDEQLYPEALFLQAGMNVRVGDSVEKVEDSNEVGYRLKSVEPLSSPGELKAHVLFFATDDTHVNTFLRIARHCPHHTFVVHDTLDLHAVEYLERIGVEYVRHQYAMPEFEQADLAVMGNDVGWEERLFILRCRKRGIPTISLQESTNVDFDGAPWRMQWTDITFVQGIHALRRHHRQRMFLTGNPRFDSLRIEPLPETPRVLINCNFTYGIGNEWGRKWLDQVIETVKVLGVAYAVTVHPRDETDLTGIDHVLPSNAFKVHEQLSASTILVSRDSSLPYEAALMGRYVIYYNPFNEPEYWLNHDDTGLIQQCYKQDELANALGDCLGTAMNNEGKEQALQSVFTGCDGANHLRVLRALETVHRRREHLRSTDARTHSYAYTWLQMQLQNVLRPRLRKIAPLRILWKAGKRLLGGYRIP